MRLPCKISREKGIELKISYWQSDYKKKVVIDLKTESLFLN